MVIEGSRFVFRGNASGVGGNIRVPRDVKLKVQAASSLPGVGGDSESLSENYSLIVKGHVPEKIVSFRSAETSAIGDFRESDKKSVTLVTSTVKVLEVEDKVKVDLVHMSLLSTHSKGSGQPSIVPKDPRIEGMSIEKFPVRIRLATEPFTRYDTREKLAKAYCDSAFFKQYGNLFFTLGPVRTGLFAKPRMPDMRGTTMVTLALSVECDHPKVKIVGNQIYLPGFGRIYVAEMLITNNSRRLSGLRFELGSPTHGSMQAAEIESNGDDLP